MSAIDTNGVSFFKDLRMALEKKGLEASSKNLQNLLTNDSLFLDLPYPNAVYSKSQLVLVNPLSEVIEKLLRADDYREFAKPDCMFLTVEEAVAAHFSTIKNQKSPSKPCQKDLLEKITYTV